jgi:hypothetical protein
MKKIMIIILLVFGIAFLNSETIKYSFSAVRKTLATDYAGFYTPENMRALVFTMAAGGLLANTNVDMRVQKWYQDDVRSQKTDDYNIVFKELGNGKILIPLFLSSTLIFENFRGTKTDNIFGEWSRRNLRSFLVGAPIMLTLQVVTGASRPNETISNWNPMKDDNGVSGHAFMGAVPFINAAEMTDILPLKILFYSGSFLTGYSRINDNRHYLSQSVLGWFMAYLSSTNLTGKDHFSVSSSYIKNDVMITAEYRF